MREIDPSHVKETSLTCSLVKIECKKAACSFRIYERSCLRQRRLFTFVHHYAFRGQLWNIDKGLWGPHKLFETFVFSPLSARCKAKEER